MPDYQKGKIYKIVSSQTDKIYIGSTALSLNERFKLHHSCRIGSSLEIVRYPDASIELIENYPCQSRKQLEKREGELQKANTDIIVNQRIAGGKSLELVKRTRQEHYIRNRDRIKAYYRNNREKLLKGMTLYQKRNPDRFKQYYIDNREKLRAYSRFHSSWFGQLCRLYKVYN